MTQQRERTHLSWERTAFSFMAVGILLAFRSGETPVHGHSFLAIAALIAAAIASLIRRRQLGGTDVAIAPARWQIGLTGALTAALGIGCAVAIWW